MSHLLPAVSILDKGALPVAQLARIAAREGVRPRDAYQAHKWFGRRFAVTARALLVGAACGRSDSFWRSFYRGDALERCVVLDPFVGGGVMLQEAARLGASVRGVDIEPVAAAIARFQTALRDLPDLNRPLRQLVESVGVELAPYYQAQDADGHPETLLHAFWVQRVQCGACGFGFDAHPRFRLASSQIDSKQWVACRECSAVVEGPLEDAAVACPCGADTPSARGHVNRGKARCPRCAELEPLIEYGRRTGVPPEFRMFAVETLPDGDAKRVNIRDRRIRSATVFDRSCYQEADCRLAEILAENPAALPPGPIPRTGRADNRLVAYGYSDYVEMFNSRQQLHLALLGAAIEKFSGAVRDGLAVAFSNHLTTNNRLCAYAGGWRRLAPLFAMPAYRHIARPVEINPWLQKNGRGTFPNSVRAVARASRALKNPREPTPSGFLRRTADSYSGSAEIACGDARQMSHIPSDSVDLVLTDPPYFDYIPYSELGHFFTPWFRRFRLISRRGKGGFPSAQIAAHARSHKAERRFDRGLTLVFREIRRVCKPDARIVFTYQNLEGGGWRSIARALAKAGLEPANAFPLYGDSSVSLHKHPHSISWDAVVVCRLSEPVSAPSIGPEDIAAGQYAASKWSASLARRDLLMTDGDRLNIAHACTVVSAFQRLASARTKTHRATVEARRGNTHAEPLSTGLVANTVHDHS